MSELISHLVLVSATPTSDFHLVCDGKGNNREIKIPICKYQLKQVVVYSDLRAKKESHVRPYRAHERSMRL